MNRFSFDIINGLLLFCCVATVFMASFNFGRQIIDPVASSYLLLIPIILLSGKLIKNRLLKVLQILFIFYVIQCFLIPLAALFSLPGYIVFVREYNDTQIGDIKWILMIVGNIAAIQLALLISSIFLKNKYQDIQLPQIRNNQCVIIFCILCLITIYFKAVLGTGKYVDGEIAANPISNLLNPFYLALIILSSNIIAFYRYRSTISKGMILMVFGYIIIETAFGSRASVIHLVYIAAISRFIVSTRISMRDLKIGIFAIVIGILTFILATALRSGNTIDAFNSAFFLADNYFDSIVIALVQRLSLIDNLYQISNQLYNPAIYDFISITQFVQSTLDLLLPGTFFPGSYSLSALNMVWLYNYDLYMLDTDWASINVPLYATNYLYFGFFSGWVITFVVVFMYIFVVILCFRKFKQVWIFFLGIYLMFNFSLLFLTSYGYEYLLRQFMFGFANIAIYGFLAISKLKIRGN